MHTTTLLYIVLAVLLSVAIAFFQYFYKTKNTPKITILLFVLRTLSSFLLGLLLINPKIKSTKTKNIKPVLSVLVDNSLSIKHFKAGASVKNIVTQLKQNQKLQDKFTVNFFSYGKDIVVLDSLSFDETQTNITKAIASVNNLNKDKVSATILISDGNQTIGNDYEFAKSKKALYPLIIGDTTQFQDLKIAQLNVNKYSYINNNFPVEVLLFYDGTQNVSSNFTITQNGKRIFSKKVTFSANQKTKTITANLKATKGGIQYFTAGIRNIENEKNTKNNSKSFAVEVINEQTKVLVLSSILHPDLGAFKKSIESNKQRQVTIELASKFKGNLKEYQLVLFYQPNNFFKKWMQERTSNYILITGTKTDWNFINSLQIGLKKNAIRQTENYAAIYNGDFTTFLQEDIQFNEFAPLEDKFGEITIQGEYQALLYQELKGIATQQPLVVTFENGEKKWSAFLGEGVWKWRATSFLQENSFETFDAFMANLVQYTVSNKKRKRLELTINSIYPANSTINIAALYLDKNYQFDNRANLQLSVVNTESKIKKVVPFSLINNSYKVSLEGLSSGNYTYKVTVEGQDLVTSGQFKVTNYQVEEQFTNANVTKLKQLALKSNGAIFYKEETPSFVNELIKNKTYYTTQKTITKEDNLINWKWLLFVVVTLLAIEWFIRKYMGKI